MLSLLVIASAWLQFQMLISAVDTGSSTQHQTVKATEDSLSTTEAAVDRVYDIIASKGCYKGQFSYRIQATFMTTSCQSFCELYRKTVQKNLREDHSNTKRRASKKHVFSMAKNTCMALPTWSLQLINVADSLLPCADGLHPRLHSCTCILRVNVESIANKTRGCALSQNSRLGPSPSQCDSQSFSTWLQQFIWNPDSPHTDEVQLQSISVDDDPTCAAFVKHYRRTRIKDGVKQFEDRDGIWKVKTQVSKTPPDDSAIPSRQNKAERQSGGTQVSSSSGKNRNVRQRICQANAREGTPLDPANTCSSQLPAESIVFTDCHRRPEAMDAENFDSVIEECKAAYMALFPAAD